MPKIDDHSTKPALFISDDLGFPQELLHLILEERKSYGLEAVTLFRTADIVVGDWVNLKCRFGCRRYDTSWCCPPATPEPDRVRSVLREYTLALLLESSQSCPDFYFDNQRKRAHHVRYWKGTVSVERLLFLKGYYKAFSLVGECCSLCKTCGYPNGCSFPGERRPSVESFSIDLFATLGRLGKKSRIAEGHKATYSHYSIVLVQ